MATRRADPSWTPSALTGQDDSDGSEEETLVSPADAETLQVYNTAMAQLSPSTETFSPLTTRLKSTWEDTSENDRKEVQEKALQGCLVVCEVVAPNARDELFHALSNPGSKESVEDDVSGELSMLMTAYRDAPL